MIPDPRGQAISAEHGGVHRRLPVRFDHDMGSHLCCERLHRTYGPAGTLWCPEHGHVVTLDVVGSGDLCSDELACSIRYGKRKAA